MADFKEILVDGQVYKVKDETARANAGGDGEGTVTGVKMNNGQPISPDENGVVDLGTVVTDVSNKVDKVTGYGLSKNDYTDADKTKLAGIETGAEANVINGIKANGASETLPVDQNGVVELPPAGSTISPATAAPLEDGTAGVGSSDKYAREDHRHPHDTSKQDTLTSSTTLMTINGNAVHYGDSVNVQGEKGDKGEQGDTLLVDENFDPVTMIINDLDTSDGTVALSARQGKVLKQAVNTVQANLQAVLSALAGIAFTNSPKPTLTPIDWTGGTFYASVNYGTMTGCGHTDNTTNGQIAEGGTLTVNLSALTGYTLTGATISVANSKGQAVSYTLSGSTLTVTNIVGSITISVIAKAIRSISLSNSSERVQFTSGTTTQVADGSSWSGSIEVSETGYKLPTLISATMGGQQVTFDGTTNVYDSTTGAITIGSVTGNVAITAVAVEANKYHISAGEHIVLKDSNDNVLVNPTVNNDGQTPFVAFISPDFGYMLSGVTVEMGGTDVTDDYYDETTGELNITAVTGEVTISATATFINTAYKNVRYGFINAMSNVGVLAVGADEAFITSPLIDLGENRQAAVEVYFTCGSATGSNQLSVFNRDGEFIDAFRNINAVYSTSVGTGIRYIRYTFGTSYLSAAKVYTAGNEDAPLFDGSLFSESSQDVTKAIRSHTDFSATPYLTVVKDGNDYIGASHIEKNLTYTDYKLTIPGNAVKYALAATTTGYLIGTASAKQTAYSGIVPSMSPVFSLNGATSIKMYFGGNTTSVIRLYGSSGNFIDYFAGQASERTLSSTQLKTSTQAVVIFYSNNISNCYVTDASGNLLWGRKSS